MRTAPWLTGSAFATVLLAGSADAVTGPWSDARPLALAGATVLTDIPATNRVLELRVGLAAAYDNPFDPRQVALDCDVTAPDGRTWTQPGFFLLPYTRSGDGVSLAAAGEWRARVLPDAPGAWRFAFRASDRSGGRAGLTSVTVTVGPAAGPGVIRRSAPDDRYFARSDGTPYFPVGVNACWSERHGLSDYDAWFAALGKAGGNWARIWMIYWHLALEGRHAEQAHFHGAGVYSMENAARLDELFAIAARHGINLMLCLDSFNELKESPGNEAWQSNPYRVEDGGPLRRLEDFWTDPEAKRLYRQKLRYLVARWGARPDLFAWEFWNEVDGTDRYDSGRIAAWHGEMAAELRRLDPARHLITTSSGEPLGDSALWKLPEIDLVQVHSYNLTDTSASLAANVATQRAYGKPVLVGEFGANVDEDEWIKSGGDRDGVHLATALWAVALSGSAGTPMLWYWGNYVHRFGLWRHFAAVSRVVDGVDWSAEHFQPVDAELAYAKRPPAGVGRAVVLKPDANGWGSRQRTFTLAADGRLDPPRGISQYLYADGKPEFASPLVIRGEFRDAATVRVQVMVVSGSATLTVAADGVTVYAHAFRTSGGKGEWRHTSYMKEWDVWQNLYDRVYEARIPAGTRELTIANTHGDWMTIGSVAIDPAVATPRPPLDVYGLAGDRTVLVYLKQSEWTWVRAMRTPPLAPCPASVLTVRGLSSGAWHVSLIATGTGKPVREFPATASGGVLTLPLPAITTDLVVKATR